MSHQTVRTMKTLISAVLLAISTVAVTEAQEKSFVWVSDPQQLILIGVRPADWFDQDNAVLYRSHALDFIRTTIGCKGGSQPPQLVACTSADKPTALTPNDYVVIHVMRWKDSATSGAQSVDKQNWYVYNNGKEDWDDDAYAKNNRIFGSRRVYLLYVHFNAKSTYLARYTLTAKKKTPAYLLHFASLLQVFGVGTTGGAVRGTQIPGAVPNAVWNAKPLDTYYVPSDLTFAPTMLPYPALSSSPSPTNAAVAPTSQPAPPAPGNTPPAPAPVATTPAPPAQSPPATATISSTLPPTSQTVLGENNPTSPPTQPANPPASSNGADSIPSEVKLDSQTFDDEGRYHLDFSVAVPVRKISELSYASSSNTLVPSKIDKQTTFGVVDYYFKPIDIKGSGWSLYPHALAGVAIDSHPLKRVLIGGGYGPLLAHIYMGLVLDTQSLPPGGSCGKIPSAQQLASGTLKNRTCSGFSVGLNVSVGSVLDSMKSKSSSGASSKAK